MPQFEITMQTRDPNSPTVRFVNHKMIVEALGADAACEKAHRDFTAKHRVQGHIRGCEQLQQADLDARAAEYRAELPALEGQETEAEPNEPMPPENPRQAAVDLGPMMGEKRGPGRPRKTA